MANKYSFSIGWSEEDQEYVATCPSFPGLSALGETEEEALAEAKIALGLFLEACKQKGVPLPNAQLVDSYSGQFRVRLPKSLHRLAAETAAIDGESLNQLVVRSVEARVGAKETGTRMLSEMRQVLAEYASQFKFVLASALTSHEQFTIEDTFSMTSSFTTSRKLVPNLNKGN